MIDRGKLVADIYIHLLGMTGKTDEWRRAEAIRQADALIAELDETEQAHKPKQRRRETVNA